jgi:hypothetical protein
MSTPKRYTFPNLSPLKFELAKNMNTRQLSTPINQTGIHGIKKMVPECMTRNRKLFIRFLLTLVHFWITPTDLVIPFRSLDNLKTRDRKLELECYEHERDQGTLGSVTGCRHNRTPGRTYGFLIRRKSHDEPGSLWNDPGYLGYQDYCQLRRLGARGGAGKPTLLSLKN